MNNYLGVVIIAGIALMWGYPHIKALLSKIKLPKAIKDNSKSESFYKRESIFNNLNEVYEDAPDCCKPQVKEHVVSIVKELMDHMGGHDDK